MDSVESAKPQCGSQPGESSEEYDLPLHVAGVFMVLFASLLGAGFPVAARKYAQSNVLSRVLFACKHFGTGVLIATAFVHLLPTAFDSLMNPCLPSLFTDDYPAITGAIMMVSMFILFVIEMYLNKKTGGHSHGLPDPSTVKASRVLAPPQRPPPPQERLDKTRTMDSVLEDEIEFEKMTNKMYEAQSNWNNADRGQGELTSTMPAWFIVFYEQYIYQRSEMIEMIKSCQLPSSTTNVGEFSLERSAFSFDEEGQTVDPAVFKKMSTNITLLECGILFHSVFVGMTVSITVDGFIVLLIAILFHQMFEGLGLGARIAAVPYPKNSPRPWILVCAFGTTAPIGQAIGLLTRNTYDPESAFGLIIVGVFNAISSGLLIYAALVDLLVGDFLSESGLKTRKEKMSAFGWVLLGALGMSIVGAFA